MADILTKSSRPGYVAVPGDPGTPPTPAYDESVVTLVPLYQVIYTSPHGGGTAGTVVEGPHIPPQAGDSWGIGTGPGGWEGWSVPGDWTESTVFRGWVENITVVHHDATVGTPPTPGIPAQPADLNIGWNSSADSLGHMAGDGIYQFSIPAGVVGVVTGLSPTLVGVAYNAIPFGMYFNSGTVRVMENGTGVTSAVSFVTTDVFTIARSGTRIQYFQNATLLYTSTNLSVGSLYANADMFMAPDAINNAALSDTVTSGFAGVTGNTSAALNNLVGFADNTGSAFAKTPLTSVTGTNTEGMTGSVTPGALTNLTVFSTNTPFAYEFPGPLTTVTGDAEANLIIPPYSVTMAPLTGLASFCWAQGGNGGQVTAGTLSGLCVFSTNTPYAYEYPGALNGLVGYATDGTLPHGVFRGWFYDWESRGSSGYQLFAQGHQDDNIVYGFFGELSGYSLSAQGGAQYHGVYKTPYGLSASGTTTLFGEAYLQLVSYPHYPLLASGTGTQMGRAYLQTGGKYVVTAQGGAQYRGTYVTPYVVTATGHAGNLGEALLTLRRHRYVVTASGTQRNFGTVTGSLTGVAASNWGRGIMRGRFSLVASGHQPVTATYEGYSVTFLGDKEVPDAPDFATTRYTDFPFTALGRLGNAYYGVGPTGIFTMDEDTLPASAPIVSTFKTGEYDVGEPTLKRARSLWLGGRMNGAFSLDVTSSEIEDDTYSYTYALTGSRKYRMKVGRGIEATYLAYTISNTDGADFEINELSPEVDVLRRSA